MISKKLLIHNIIENKILKTTDIIDAFYEIDRIDFVPPMLQNETYNDYPLPIGNGQTISQPTTVAFMLELLSPQKSNKILDLGSGSGWTTALLAHIVGKEGKVIGIERVESLVEFAKNNLAKYDLPQASIKLANNTLGIEEEKFDKILVSASADHFPYNLLEQLKENGKLVIPVQNSIYLVEKRDGRVFEKEYPGFVFVPLIF